MKLSGRMGRAAWLFAIGVLCAPPVAAQSPCDAEDAHPWIGEASDRLLRYSRIVQYALHGSALESCEGSVDTEFDGRHYGSVRLTFANGLEFDLQTMPLETAISELSAPGGFDDPDEVRALLRADVEQRGYSVDWSEAQIETEGDTEVHVFWDPDPGMNASGRFVYRDGVLVAIRFSSAL